MPGTVTIETNQRIRFRGEVHTSAGRVPTSVLSWEATGGSIDSAGFFSADRPGTYRIIGRGHGRRALSGGTRWEGAQLRQPPDTSIVVVVRRQPKLASIQVTPRGVQLDVGATQTFLAEGLLPDGTRKPIGVVWTATGGAIDPSGTYQAGTVPGAYRVIATNTRGTIADTVAITVVLPQPQPTPDPTPEPDPVQPLADRVVLRPATVTLATSATHQFAAFGRTSTGDSIAVEVTFRATGGTVTPTGLYTAGATAGTFRVIATSNQLADTAVVTLASTAGGGTPEPVPSPEPIPTDGSRGIPFGPFGSWSGTSLRSNSEVFTSGINNVTPSNLLTRISVARSMGLKMFVQMTGGHEPYLTNGVFDMAKWKAAMNLWNTPTLKQAVAAAVADGTIIGNSVMDEPHVSGMGDGNTWGPKGTMTKVLVDEMCGYAKNIFPTLPVGVVHQHHIFEPEKTYNVCEFIVDQYSARFGSVTRFRDEALAYGRRDGIAIAFSMNIINGGNQAARDGLWNCPLTTTGGRGTFDPNCRMTAQQVRDWGLILGSAGCGLVMWRYDDAFMARADNQQAFRDIATRLATLPAKSCAKPVS